MNYYEHHLGDYAKDTAHLSMLEHGAYRLLLDRYYSTEEGIPAAQAHRVARARSKEERDAVDTVLQEFFVLRDDVWVNGRAEEEVAKAQAKINAAQTNG
uniref:YdaU family protein n=1 Tax=Klebsiella pneumoniae TaxID=573 RepID=UPI0022302F18